MTTRFVQSAAVTGLAHTFHDWAAQQKEMFPNFFEILSQEHKQNLCGLDVQMPD